MFALAATRAALALAAAVILVALLAPAVTVRAPRALVAAAAALIVAAGAAARLVAGGVAPAGETDGDALRLAALFFVVVGVAGAWLVVRRLSSGALTALAVAAIVGCGAALAVSGWSPGSAVEGADAGFSHGRAALWSDAAGLAADRPLAGAGADAFRAVGAAEGLPHYAHNLPLELAVELGVPGLLLGLALLGAVCLALWRARHSRSLWLLGPGVAAFVAANLVDWSWHLTSAAALWAIALGALCAAPLRKDPA